MFSPILQGAYPAGHSMLGKTRPQAPLWMKKLRTTFSQSWSPLHLRQRRLRLRQPEGHLHGVVQRDSSRKLGAGLLWPAAPCIQRTEATVAVSLQWAHAKLLGQGEGMAIVGGGLFDLRRLALGGNVTKETQGPCLVAPFLVSPGEPECLLGKGQRLPQTA